MSVNIRENKVSRNTLFLTIAYTLQKVISFGYFIYYARFIGYIGTGKFVFAISFATVFGIIVDLGLNPVLIREVARVKDKVGEYLSAVFTIKIFFALIAIFLIFIAINLLGYPIPTKNLVYFATAVMILESFTLTFFAILRGFQNLKFEAIGTIIYQIITVSVGVIGLQITHNPLVLGVAITFGALGNFSYALFSLRKKLKISPRYKMNFGTFRYLLKMAMPFFLAGIFIKIYAYIDILLLSFLKRGDNGDQYVGWYSVAYKLTYAIQFIPLAFNNSIYPALSAFWIKSKELLVGTVENAFRYLIIISLPISFGAFALADKITVLFTSEYASSIPAFRISIMGLVFIFINLILSSILNACNKQKINTLNIGLTVVFNVTANLILIPHFNHIGASIAALSSAVFLYILHTYQTRKFVKYSFKSITQWFLKSLISSLVMALVIYLLKPSVNFILLIPVGITVYTLVLYALKGFSKHDLIRVKQSFIRRKNE